MATPDDTPPSPTAAQHFTPSRQRTSTMSSVAASITTSTRKVAGSVGQAALDALNSDPPLGAWAAAAEATSRAPTFGEIRTGSFAEDGWRGETQREMRRNSIGDSAGKRWKLGRTGSSAGGVATVASVRESGEFDRKEAGLEPFPALAEEPTHASQLSDPRIGTQQQREEVEDPSKTSDILLAAESISPTESSAKSEPIHTPSQLSAQQHHHHHQQQQPEQIQRKYSSGYIPPPKLPWTVTTWIGLKGFWKWFLTPFGFLVTVYCLNVVAWGGMLFLLLCGAAPGMCWVQIDGVWRRECNNINAPRRIWLEIDSQILNALFCVTGFGLIPWRFRDLYYLLRFRLTSERKHGREAKLHGLRTLAGINNTWFRLPGHDTLDEQSTAEYNPSDPHFDPRLAHPLTKSPTPPLTGIRAPPTALWKLDFFIWCNVWNTFFQACLCGFMWGMNRYDRPSWSTGLFIALACIIAGVGGIVTFIEGKGVKRVEGVQPSAAVEAEVEKMRARERGEGGGVELGHARRGGEGKLNGDGDGPLSGGLRAGSVGSQGKQRKDMSKVSGQALHLL